MTSVHLYATSLTRRLEVRSFLSESAGTLFISVRLAETIKGLVNEFIIELALVKECPLGICQEDQR